jgi:hypothetical protein
MRVANRLLVFVVGAALLAGGLLVILEGIWTWTNSGFVWIPGDEWLSSFKTTPWSANVVIVISGAVGAVGLVLLAAQLKPQPKRLLVFPTDVPGEWRLVRRSTQRRIARRVASEVPVSPVRARLKGRARSWKLTVKARAAQSSAPALKEAAERELSRLRAPQGSRVRVRATGATATAPAPSTAPTPALSYASEAGRGS